MGSTVAAASGPGQAPNDTAAGGAESLRARVAELERERDQLVAVVDVQREIAGGAHYLDVLQSVTQVLGRSFSLDRCSVYLAGGPSEARLVASFENPAIRNLVVDLDRYPELRRVFATGEPLYIKDAARDSSLAAAHDAFALRNVGAIAVVPIKSRGATLGAIFLRTDRDAAHGFSAHDVRFAGVVADLAAQALHNARRADTPPRPAPAVSTPDPRRELLLAFVARLLARDAEAAPPVAPAAAAEVDRLAEVVLRVIGEEAVRA